VIKFADIRMIHLTLYLDFSLEIVNRAELEDCRFIHLLFLFFQSTKAINHKTYGRIKLFYNLDGILLPVELIES
jgi:hypothetical protein